jgi:hypothetical protein
MPDSTLNQPESTPTADQTYTQPAIVHELKLETRAGSPLGGDPIIDPLGIDPA